ncbi:MAG: hypothetical protein KatS3mg087_0838 [Patescibacteria group bacterium]|nr:MAG: hypothetical protein KatS3mg087_0838 [Patescibacteria group bacterium]
MPEEFNRDQFSRLDWGGDGLLTVNPEEPLENKQKRVADIAESYYLVADHYKAQNHGGYHFMEIWDHAFNLLHAPDDKLRQAALDVADFFSEVCGLAYDLQKVLVQDPGESADKERKREWVIMAACINQRLAVNFWEVFLADDDVVPRGVESFMEGLNEIINLPTPRGSWNKGFANQLERQKASLVGVRQIMNGARVQAALMLGYSNDGYSILVPSPDNAEEVGAVDVDSGIDFMAIRVMEGSGGSKVLEVVCVDSKSGTHPETLDRITGQRDVGDIKAVFYKYFWDHLKPEHKAVEDVRFWHYEIRRDPTKISTRGDFIE